MDARSRRGVVPVLRRPSVRPRRRRLSERPVAGGITQTAAGQMREADVDEAGQERAGGEQHMPGMEGQALGRAHAGGMAVLFQHLGHGVLPDAQAGRENRVFLRTF